MGSETDLIALPMHGEVKLRNEGYRTRDGHILEWIERLRPGLDVTVRSRPEPFPRVSLARRNGRVNPEWTWQSPQPITLPPLKTRRRWWVKSLDFEPKAPVTTKSVLIWNPIAGADLLDRVIRADRVVVDLLDDWSIHIAFQPIRSEVESAYAKLFARADAITANSEGTVALAARFGHEAELITNGCDPDRFAAAGDRRSGTQPIVGYVGKLSERLDVELVEATARALPEVRFEIHGPYAVAAKDTVRQIQRLDRLPNVDLGGNIPYEELPERIASWDVGWVPHRVGAGEVGGDVMKIYEYRAAGLPAVMTPVIGSDRALPGVEVAADANAMVEEISRTLGPPGSPRPARVPIDLPAATTWQYKTERILNLLDI